ncbi:MAG: thioredoxin-disulfide reductase [Actinobacteria bacterium]|nr:thioredoxin-disulfide reductase [Actinomycetota bacterium]
MKYEIAIVGGGPAGLSAAIYASRALVKVALLEKGLCGGQAATTDLIENYPGFPDGISGMKLMEMFSKQAERFETEIFTFSEVKSIERSGSGFALDLGDGKLMSSAIIYCAGQSPSKLGIRGEEEFYGRGVSYCATCDGALYRGKEVVVVGGGDSAIEEAIFLTRYASCVTVIHRRDELRAAKIIQKRAFENPKIRFELNAVLDEISGGQFVESVRVRKLKDDSLKEINAQGVFIYVGYKPNSSLLADLVELDERGYVITDSDCYTSQLGILAAGDVRRSGLKQVATSVSDGAIAAMSAIRYLESL